MGERFGTRPALVLFIKPTTGWPSENRFGIESGVAMLGWAITFLVIALIAAVLGFGVVAGTAAWIAKLLFLVFLVLFVLSLLFGNVRRPA